MAWVEMQVSRKQYATVMLEVPDEFDHNVLNLGINEKVIAKALEVRDLYWVSDYDNPEVEYTSLLGGPGVGYEEVHVDLSKLVQ